MATLLTQEIARFREAHAAYSQFEWYMRKEEREMSNLFDKYGVSHRLVGVTADGSEIYESNCADGSIYETYVMPKV